MCKLSGFILMTLLITCTHFLIARQASDILKPDLGIKLGSCPMCGMDVSEHMLTRVDLAKGDTMIHACALGCASAMLQQHQYDNILVCDYDSTGMIPAMEAYYLFGSRVVPARSMLPEISFASRESAVRFQKRHGGTLLHGKEAFDIAGKIRQERMSDKKKGKQ